MSILYNSFSLAASDPPCLIWVTTKGNLDLTRWVFLPPEFFHTEWKTSPAQRRWETVHCSCTDTDCEDDVCSDGVTTSPSGRSFQSSDLSLQTEKGLLFSVSVCLGDSVTCSVCVQCRSESMWWCRSELSYSMFVQGVVQYSTALEVLTSWEHTMCSDTHCRGPTNVINGGGKLLLVKKDSQAQLWELFLLYLPNFHTVSFFS